MQRQCEADGVRCQRIAVDYAAHSVQVEELREELLAAFAAVTPRPGEIPFCSTVSGGPLETTELDAEYWYRNLRQPVLLEPAIRSLLDAGQRAFIEVSPHPVLAFGLQETVDDVAPQGGAAVLPSLQRDDSGPRRFARSLAAAHVAGVEVDWRRSLGAVTSRLALPTYPFQRRRYWTEPAAAGRTDPAAIGQAALDHPLLGAAIEQPGAGATIMTGRLSLQAQPWLADHAVAGTVLFPGTGFLELALRAGREAGASLVEELALEQPLVLPQRGGVQVRVAVAGDGDEGRRELEIHSRPEGGGEWTRNAQGTLAAAAGQDPQLQRFASEAWPPAGADPLAVGDLYGSLAGHGFEFGPAFQCVRAAWRRGDELFAELALGEDDAAAAAGFLVHPALLDAAGHVGVGLALAEEEAGEDLPLPFAWRGVSAAAAGASALRVRIGSAEDGGLLALDGQGAPVARIESVAIRRIGRAQLRAAAGESSLYRVRWEAPPAAAPSAEPVDLEVADLRAEDGIDDSPDGRAAAVLERLQSFLAEPANESRRLVVVTGNAVAAAPGEGPDPRLAAVWGLVRSAQAEHPGRFALLDSDGDAASEQALANALALGGEEPQLALRAGRLRVPRIVRAPAPDSEAATDFDPERTVLITGGLGGLGALVAEHLAEAHGARHLLLASRGGPESPGAAELRASLEQRGAEVRIASCDVSSRSELESLLASIPAAHPLGAVIHSAAVLDDGVLESQDAERLAAVMAPKALAARHLHELTADLELSHFVLFSSAAGLLGNPGQAGYAAANAYLDALAERRRAAGLPALSIAWGALDVGTTLLGDEEAARIAALVRRRLGVVPIESERAIGLFDAALSLDEPLLAAVDFDLAELRASAAARGLAPLQRGLVPASSAQRQRQPSLAERLAAVAAEQRQGVALDLVREQVAAVLGHASAAAVDPERPFGELGFDSLAALELRNRLGAATGLHLRPTLVFDYPSVSSLAAYLLTEAMPGTEAGEAGAGPEERAFREALARLPLARLRDAGLIEDLVELVGVGEGLADSHGDEVSIGQIDALDPDELIERTLAQAAESEAEGGE